MVDHCRKSKRFPGRQQPYLNFLLRPPQAAALLGFCSPYHSDHPSISHQHLIGRRKENCRLEDFWFRDHSRFASEALSKRGALGSTKNTEEGKEDSFVFSRCFSLSSRSSSKVSSTLELVGGESWIGWLYIPPMAM
ncbi:uncharacterized protein LOC121051146 [Rosa chinensis]|uniref:uncharacterized protein LOC121051146 n=1 Tax=Rosa chinensis TaxID=74649 RepID=UPI001AD8E5A4|nr:uncharacterized protein LOC121051146 [Rosa chinensis]